MSNAGKPGSKQRGFTIVETLIVLAVTGALFLMATLAINGKQNSTEFQQSINDVQSVLRQSIEQVGSGDYPDTNNFTCDGTTGTVNIQPGTGRQGSNNGCIFVGKVLQFGVASTDPQKYISYTIAGLKDNSGSITQAKPVAIAPGQTTNSSAGYPDASISGMLHSGLTAVSMNYVDGGGAKHPIGAVAFLSSLGNYNGSSLLSGSQQLSLVPVAGSGNAGTLSTNPLKVVDAINNNLATSPVNPAGGVQICFASGGTKQSGLITIGSNGHNLAVNLQIKSTRDCS